MYQSGATICQAQSVWANGGSLTGTIQNTIRARTTAAGVRS
jgi:hypothetical protein